MPQPDLERAKQYAFERLERDLPPTAHYHSLHHTRDDVVPAVERLAALEGVEGDDRLCLLTAACYHDLGHIEHRDDHESVSVRIAAEALPRFGYSPALVERITDLILATRWPPHPQTLLEKIIADADLDSLGRDDFLGRSLSLRKELESIGITSNDEEWYQSQLEFLSDHHYHTQAARKLRGPGKQRNIELVKRLLAETQESKT